MAIGMFRPVCGASLYSRVSFACLGALNAIRVVSLNAWGVNILAAWTFTDKSVLGYTQVNSRSTMVARVQDYGNMYGSEFAPENGTSDHYIIKVASGSATIIANEAIDIDNKGRGFWLSVSGSTLKSMRIELTSVTDPLSPTAAATITATDTAFTSGYFGFRWLRETSPHGGASSAAVFLMDPASPGPQAYYVAEVEITGSGTPEDPYRPNMPSNLVEIGKLGNVPDFLKADWKKYQILKSKGFTDEEIKTVFGPVQTHVDLLAVSTGGFEIRREDGSGVVFIYGPNPYDQSAHEKVRSRVKALKPPKDRNEAKAMLKSLSSGKNWIAGVDNFVYMATGLEEYEAYALADFYYGELVEHRTHYNQLKQVSPDILMASIQNAKNMVMQHGRGQLRDEHLQKIRRVETLGF